MKKLFTLFAAFLLTLSAMADVYKIDPSKEIILEDPNMELDGVIGVITNLEGTKVLSLGGGNEWDITSIDLKDWGSKHADYNYVLFEKTESFGLYKIRMANADKTFYSPSWAEPAGDGCINFQPYPGTGVFVGGNKNQGGTDVMFGGLFHISVTIDENFKFCGYQIGNQKADENDLEPKYLVPGIGQKGGYGKDITVKLYSALVIDIPASVEAAYKTVPANVKNDAVEAAYAKAKANPTQANLDALKAAIAAIGKSSLINNAGIDGNTQGWTCNLPQGGGGPMKPSNDAMEFWAGSAEPRNDASFDYYQEITVPNGKYVLQAEMFNSSNSEEGTGHAPNGNAGLYASSGSDEVFVGVTTDSEVLAQYTTDVLTVKDGKIRIGVKSKGYMSARWFVADNFKLWYAGDDPTTGISNTATDDKKIMSIKTIENGQLVIMRDGKKYNAQGQKM